MTNEEICNNCGHPKSSHEMEFIEGKPFGSCYRNWGDISSCKCKCFCPLKLGVEYG